MHQRIADKIMWDPFVVKPELRLFKTVEKLCKIFA